MRDEYKKGGKVIICRFYADILPDTEGTVIKSWTIKNTTWIKVLLGFNLSRQKITRTFPADCLKKVT